MSVSLGVTPNPPPPNVVPGNCVFFGGFFVCNVHISITHYRVFIVIIIYYYFLHNLQIVFHTCSLQPERKWVVEVEREWVQDCKWHDVYRAGSSTLQKGKQQPGIDHQWSREYPTVECGE